MRATNSSAVTRNNARSSATYKRINITETEEVTSAWNVLVRVWERERERKRERELVWLVGWFRTSS